jgi:hypothetical protein
MNSTPIESNINRLLQTWPPANPMLVKQVNEKLDRGYYKGNRQLLIEDLKGDVSLFLYCLRELALSEQNQSSDFNDPTKLFLETDVEKLKEILGVELSEVSPYSLANAKSFHGTQLLSTVTGASVASSLSDVSSLPAYTSFTCGLLRQLGLTLVAWGYPTVYRKATESTKPGESIDSKLGDMLGFSPSLLGIKIARSWRLDPTVMMGMGDSGESYEFDSEEEKRRAEVVGETLSRVCELGELFAAGLDKERDSSGLQESWKGAVSRIEELLGQDGFITLQKTIQKVSSAYAAFAPNIFQWDIAPLDRAEKPVVPPERLFDDNVYIKHCPREIQEALKALYEELRTTTNKSPLLKEIVENLMPSCGFSRGCIFLIEPQSRMLAPRLTFGSLDKADVKPISYTTREQDPLAAAFRANAPVTGEHEMSINGTFIKIPYIAGVLGETQRAGLLYVEFDIEMPSLRGKSPIMYYKALRQALSDCLGIR